MVFGCWLWSAPQTAFADESDTGWLSVTRGASAEDCPTADELVATTEALLEHPPPHGQLLLRVEFEHQAGRYVARLLRLDVATGARELADDHPECATLSQAVVTALALMLDTRAARLSSPPPPPSRPEPQAVAKEPEPARPPPPAQHRFGIELQGGAALGVVERRRFAPYFEGGLGLGSGAFRASLGALWLPSQRSELGPGYVDTQLIAVTTRACVRLIDAALDLFACSGVFGGTLRAEAQGYTVDYSEQRPWLALPFELSLAGKLSEGDGLATGFRLGATLLVPARRQTFSVEGLGTAVEPARFAVLAWFGLDSSLLW